jgi:hypothetical protein
VNNICNLSASALPTFMQQKCLADPQLNMLDGGILLSMTFFSRYVEEAVAALRLQYVNLSLTYNGTDFFNQLDFTEIDKMTVYMFKIYQLSQGACYNSFIQIISTLSANFLRFTGVFILI